MISPASETGAATKLAPDTPTRPRGETFQTVQALRGVAALLVVAFHCADTARERLGGPKTGLLGHGTAGVDIFFVISGFVMVVSSQGLIERAGGWRIFVERRLARIVPLYWLLTSVKLATVLRAPSLSHHDRPGLVNIICSYLFIPSRNGAGEVFPVLPPGWTLSFEMLFYAVFAFCLGMRIKLFRIAVPFFVALACISIWRQEDWPGWTTLASALPLEFLFGAVVGELTLRGRRLSPRMAAICCVAGVLAVIVLPVYIRIGPQGATHLSLRVLDYGVPGALLLAGLVALESRLRPYLWRWVLAIGDASYSIYLGHGFVVAFLALEFARHAQGRAGAFIVAGMVASLLGGLVLYYGIEKSLQRLLRGKILRPALAG